MLNHYNLSELLINVLYAKSIIQYPLLISNINNEKNYLDIMKLNILLTVRKQQQKNNKRNVFYHYDIGRLLSCY